MSCTHSHAAGGTPHTHGCWCLPAGPLTPDDHDDGSPEPHRHFVLFGVEFPGDAVPDAAPAGPGVGHVGPAGGPDCDRPHPHPTDCLAGPSPAVLTAAAAASPPPVPSAPPSAFARRAVTGVLRS